VLGSARKARDVVLVVLHCLLQHLEAEHLRRAARRQRRGARELLLRDELGPAGGVVHRLHGGAELLQVAFTLRQRLRVRVDDADVPQRGAGQRLEAMHDVELDLAGD
jgi:hypothetical protein